MCSYKYIHSYNNFDHICCIESYFQKTHELPIDSNGRCIFHSSDIQWQYKNDFQIYLTELLKIAELSKAIALNLYECHFIPTKIGEKIDYLHKLFGHSFDGSSFKGEAYIENITIQDVAHFFFCKLNSLVFRNCKFEKDVNFSSIEFEKYGIEHKLKFKNCEFYYSFSIEYCESFNADIEMTGCTFKQQVNIDHNQFKGDFNVYSTFKCPLILRKNKFTNGIAVFSGSIFEGSFEVEDCSFNNHTSFSEITAKDVILIKGKETNKVFNSKVLFKIDVDNFDGQLIFEHVDLNFVIKEHLMSIYALEKQGKAVIGSGCIKYRHQTGIREISIVEGFHSLIEEMADTFSSYFINFCGINLGVEIVSRSKDSIKLFYYSDANITDAEFNRAFSNTQFSYLHLLKKPTSSDSTLLVGNQMSDSSAFSVLMSLISIASKASFNINKGEWTEKESQALFETIALPDQKIEDVKIPHEFVKSIDWKLFEEMSRKSGKLINIVLQIGKTNINSGMHNGDIHGVNMD